MYSRRKNGDSSRNKRLPKRYRVFEFLSSSCVQHTKVVLIWMMFLFLNYSTGMRVEYFWPGWLFLCSINESLRFEGLHFAFVFILIVLAIDLISFLVIPITWLFYLGSAYVWIYLLWHIDKGICLPTCILFMIFMYFEFEFRSKDLKCSNHSIYLFRPFASHCIGYPAVCIGYSMKNYLEIKYKMRKKMDVRIQNETYYSMVDEALYPSIADMNAVDTSSLVQDRILDEFDEKRTFNEIKLTSCLLNGDLEYRSSMDSGSAAILFYPFTCPDTNIFDSKRAISNFLSSFSSLPVIRTLLAIGRCAFYSTNQPTPSSSASNPNTRYNSANPSENEKSYSNDQSNNNNSSNGDNGPSCPLVGTANTNSSNNQHNSNIQVKKHGSFNKTKSVSKNAKSIDINSKLEITIKKLTTDLHSIKAAENQLRLQLSQIEAESKSFRENYTIQRRENELLSSEISKLSSRNKTDKTLLNQLESQIVSERKARTSIEESISKLKAASSNSKNNSCSETLNGKSSKNASNQGPSNGAQKKVTEARQNCTCGDDFSCLQKLKRLEGDLKNMQIQIRQRDESLKMNNGTSKNVWQSNGSLTKQQSLEETRKTLHNRITQANSERLKLTNKLREYGNLREELLAAYNKSHNGICELKGSLNQRNATISQLQEKLVHFDVLHHGNKTATNSTSLLDNGLKKGPTVSSYDNDNGVNLSLFEEPRGPLDPAFLKHQQHLFRNSTTNNSSQGKVVNSQQRLNHDPWGYMPPNHTSQSYNCFSNSLYDNPQTLSYKSISPPLNSNGTFNNLQASTFKPSDSSMASGGTYRSHTDNQNIHDYMGSGLSTVLNQCSTNGISDEDLSSHLDVSKASTLKLFNNNQGPSPGRLSGILSNFKNHNFSSPVLRQCAKNALLENFTSNATATSACSGDHIMTPGISTTNTSLHHPSHLIESISTVPATATSTVAASTGTNEASM